MRRSIVIHSSNNNNHHSIIDSNKQQRKRPLEDNDVITKTKKRRHLSPQHENHTKSSPNLKRKSKTRSSLNDSANGKKNKSHTSRKSSTRRRIYSTEHLKEITLPNWDIISPNIDQILSNKHTQSGVYAHEVHLVQQELEALLSMSSVRQNLLKELLQSKIPINTDSIRSIIRQHQQAEYVYSSKKAPIKPIPPLINQPQQRHNGPHLLLDRQVSMTPIIGARIDKIWSDINTYYHKISSNDLSSIENLVEFNQQLEEKIQQYQTEYRNNILTQSNISEQLNEENFQELINITEINPLITHYIDRTTIGRFQTNLYEHVPHMSPVYKTPISSPFYRKSLGNYLDNSSSLRSSPRLHPNHRLAPLSNLNDHDQSSLLKSKKKTRMISPNPLNVQERVQLVHDYLSDQHPLKVKRQLFNDIKSTRKRKTSITIHNEHCIDTYESKLSTLISLLNESSILTSNALNRARLQSTNEQTWQKLNTIEHELELLIQKIDMAGGSNNSTSTEKTLHTLDHLLKDWKKYEDDFDRQLEQLFADNN